MHNHIEPPFNPSDYQAFTQKKYEYFFPLKNNQSPYRLNPNSPSRSNHKEMESKSSHKEGKGKGIIQMGRIRGQERGQKSVSPLNHTSEKEKNQVEAKSKRVSSQFTNLDGELVMLRHSTNWQTNLSNSFHSPNLNNTKITRHITPPRTLSQSPNDYKSKTDYEDNIAPPPSEENIHVNMNTLANTNMEFSNVSKVTHFSRLSQPSNYATSSNNYGVGTELNSSLKVKNEENEYQKILTLKLSRILDENLEIKLKYEKLKDNYDTVKLKLDSLLSPKEPLETKDISIMVDLTSEQEEEIQIQYKLVSNKVDQLAKEIETKDQIYAKENEKKKSEIKSLGESLKEIKELEEIEKQKMESYHEENKRLTTCLEKSQKDNEELRVIIEELKNTTESLGAKVLEIESERNDLETENTALNQQSEILTQASLKLQLESETISKENVRLKNKLLTYEEKQKELFNSSNKMSDSQMPDDLSKSEEKVIIKRVRTLESGHEISREFGRTINDGIPILSRHEIESMLTVYEKENMTLLSKYQSKLETMENKCMKLEASLTEILNERKIKIDNYLHRSSENMQKVEPIIGELKQLTKSDFQADDFSYIQKYSHEVGDNFVELFDRSTNTPENMFMNEDKLNGEISKAVEKLEEIWKEKIWRLEKEHEREIVILNESLNKEKQRVDNYKAKLDEKEQIIIAKEQKVHEIIDINEIMTNENHQKIERIKNYHHQCIAKFCKHLKEMKELVENLNLDNFENFYEEFGDILENKKQITLELKEIKQIQESKCSKVWQLQKELNQNKREKKDILEKYFKLEQFLQRKVKQSEMQEIGEHFDFLKYCNDLRLIEDSADNQNDDGNEGEQAIIWIKHIESTFKEIISTIETLLRTETNQYL